MIKINGKVIFEGIKKVVVKNLVISDDRLIINGKEIDLDKDQKTFNIEISGDVNQVEVDVCNVMKISGNVGYVETASGDVTCGDVINFVKTVSGSVECGTVRDVDTISGNVKAKSISGNVKTVSGDIKI